MRVSKTSKRVAGRSGEMILFVAGIFVGIAWTVVMAALMAEKDE